MIADDMEDLASFRIESRERLIGGGRGDRLINLIGMKM